MNNENLNLLNKGAELLDIKLSAQQNGYFSLFYQMLMDWNKKINLTAIVDEREVVIKHFIDSISVLHFIPKNASKLIDVGTGAGFPGIPLKIVQNDLEVTLLDSLAKRVRFLNCVIEECNFTGIRAIHGRAEDFGQDKDYRESYDIGIARAVSSLSVLCEYILPFIKIGGSFISMKGSNVKEEIKDAKKAISILGGEIEKEHNLLLPFEHMERNLIFIKKIRHTPTKYPRKSGKPSKYPLV